MRILLTFLLIMVLISGIFATVQYWEPLNQIYLAGPVIIGLIFFAVAAFGLYLDLNQGIEPEASWPEILKHFIKRLPPVMAVVIGFSGGAWLLLLMVRFLFSSWLPDWAVGTLFIIAFTWFVAGVIKVLTWFSDRRLDE